MSGRYNPKTLVKTLSTIAYRSPGEYGLFWDPDGSMPWKELYWALQEDPSLRFVRESHIRELNYLGLDIPFMLEGNRLRLKDGFSLLAYPPVEFPPGRLYHACGRKRFPSVRMHGLAPSSRHLVPMASERELAERIGKRRDPEPVIIEVLARKASLDGMPVVQAGPQLFLMGVLPPDYLVLPLIREAESAREPARRDARPGEVKPNLPGTPGSFYMDIKRFSESQPQGANASTGPGKKRGKGGDWKRSSRKDRTKRNV